MLAHVKTSSEVSFEAAVYLDFPLAEDKCAKIFFNLYLSVDTIQKSFDAGIRQMNTVVAVKPSRQYTVFEEQIITVLNQNDSLIFSSDLVS